MNNRQALTRLFWTDRFTWLYLPGLIVLLSFAVNLIVAYYVEGVMVTGGVVSIFIFMFIMGVMVTYQYFSFIAGLSVRRTDFLTGILQHIAGVGVIFGMLVVGLAYVEVSLTEGWSQHMYFFSVMFGDNASIASMLISFILWLMHSFCLGLVFGCAYRRFGKISVYVIIFGGIFVSGLAVWAMHRLGVLEISMMWLEQGAGLQVEGGGNKRFISWLAERSAFDYSLATVPFTLVYIALSYVFLRRADV